MFAASRPPTFADEQVGGAQEDVPDAEVGTQSAPVLSFKIGTTGKLESMDNRTVL
jgi:hypothetical protein